MSTSRGDLSEDRKDSEVSDEVQDIWSRGDLEELDGWANSESVSKHVHYKLKLEDTIAKQNSLIESLQDALENAKNKNDKLLEELYTAKEDATSEVESLKKNVKELQSKLEKEREDGEEKMKQMCNMKKEIEKEIEEKYSSKIVDLQEQLRLKIEEEMANQTKLKISAETIQKSSLKECFLLRQVSLLANRIDELYERGISHDNELEASRRVYTEELNQMKDTLSSMKSTQPMPENKRTIYEELVESKTNEVTLCIQLSSQKKAYESAIKNLEEKLNSYSVEVSKLKDFQDMAKEREIQSEKLSITVTNYNTVLSDLYIKLNNLFHKISLLFLFLNNAGLNSLSDFIESHQEFDVINHDRYFDNVSDLISKTNNAIEEIDKIKLLVAVCKDKETLFVSVDDLKHKNEENDKLIKSLQAEINDINEKLFEANSQRLDFEKRCNILGKENVNLQNELSNKELRCQQLLSDKVSLEKKLNDFNKQYSQQMENILSHINYWKNTPVRVMDNLQHTPSNESFDINLLQKDRCDWLNVATSTPYPNNLRDLLGGGECVQSSTSIEKDYSNFALLKWMEKCQILSHENKQLTNEIENLKSQISDLEDGAQILKEEMDVFEIKRQNLESKISDYEEKKRKLIDVKEENQRYVYEIDCLKDQINKFDERNEKLQEENLKLEGNFKNFINSNNSINEEMRLNEKCIYDLNERIKEIISLKSKVFRLQDSNDKLIIHVDRLNDSKNLYVLKLEQTFEQLCIKEDEMEDLLRNKLQAETENKLLTKKVELLNLQIDRLKIFRNNNNQKLDPPGLMEHMQKDLLNLYKNVIESKLEIDKLRLEKRDDFKANEFDARHRYDILVKSNSTLQNEKESYLLQIKELQKLLHDSQILQNNQGFDGGWLLRLEEKEMEFIDEMREQRNQFARFEEALRSTGKLHDELQQQKDELRFKMIDMSKLEKKLHEEKANFKKVDLKNKELLLMIVSKDDQIKNVVEEKIEMEKDFKSLHERLIEVESKYATEKRATQWRLARADLLLSQDKIDQELMSILEEKNVEYDNDLHSEFKKDIERSYYEAIENIKTYFSSEYASAIAKEKGEHIQQV